MNKATIINEKNREAMNAFLRRRNAIEEAFVADAIDAGGYTKEMERLIAPLREAPMPSWDEYNRAWQTLAPEDV